jgi:hypothetical protein
VPSAENLTSRRLGIISKVLFSIYFSTVLFAIEEDRSLSWSTQFRLWYFEYRRPSVPKPIDDPHFERAVAFVLAWLVVIVLLILLRFMNRLTAANIALQWLIGFTALAGLPTAMLFAGYGNQMEWFGFVGVSGIAAYVCVFRRPQISRWISFALLCFYFVLSTWLIWRSGTTFPLVMFTWWPGFDWILGTYPIMKNVFPIIGFLLSAVWLMWVKVIQACCLT